MPQLPLLLIHQLVQDRAGLLWVAAEEGLFRYEGYYLVPLSALASLPPGFSLDHTLVLALDARQQLWIGCSRGLFRLRGRRLGNSHSLPGQARSYCRKRVSLEL